MFTIRLAALLIAFSPLTALAADGPSLAAVPPTWVIRIPTAQAYTVTGANGLPHGLIYLMAPSAALTMPSNAAKCVPIPTDITQQRILIPTNPTHQIAPLIR